MNKFKKSLVPIQITSLHREAHARKSGNPQITQGRFEVQDAESLFAYSAEKDPQPYILLGKEALYDLVLTIMDTANHDLASWLTAPEDNRRQIAELIAKWKKNT